MVIEGYITDFRVRSVPSKRTGELLNYGTLVVEGAFLDVPPGLVDAVAGLQRGRLHRFVCKSSWRAGRDGRPFARLEVVAVEDGRGS